MSQDIEYNWLSTLKLIFGVPVSTKRMASDCWASNLVKNQAYLNNKKVTSINTNILPT